MPQAPQFIGSEVSSTHAPEQSVSPVPQPVVEHVPALQTSPLAHAVAQLPQCIGSLARTTHAPEHSVVAASHAQPVVVQI